MCGSCSGLWSGSRRCIYRSQLCRNQSAGSFRTECKQFKEFFFRKSQPDEYRQCSGSFRCFRNRKRGNAEHCGNYKYRNGILSDILGTQQQQSESAGSGIIIKQDSKYLYIATNNHVVADADSLKVQFVDNETVECKVQGTDASDDLAVVKVALSDIKDSTLKEIKVATVNEDTDTLEVGQGVIAIGNALGYGQSVTNGIISALGRTVTVQDEQTGETVVNNNMIQTNAAINPGNSGGALLNASGEVVGINSAKYSDTSVEGFGYAIPMSDAMPIVEQLIEKGQVDQSKAAFLGIQGQDISSSVASAYNMPQGVYVYQVVSDHRQKKQDFVRGILLQNLTARQLQV